MTAPPAVELGSLLESHPDYRQGRPCLRGTKIPVHTIAAMAMSGMSTEEILADWPHVAPELIHAALAYYLANREQIEPEIETDRVYGEEQARRYPDGMNRKTLGLD